MAFRVLRRKVKMVEKRLLNRQWHEAHVLGQRASLDERVEWHLEDARESGCRPIPARVREQVERRSGSSRADQPLRITACSDSSPSSPQFGELPHDDCGTIDDDGWSW